jgi:hypothetical protein
VSFSFSETIIDAMIPKLCLTCSHQQLDFFSHRMCYVHWIYFFVGFVGRVGRECFGLVRLLSLYIFGTLGFIAAWLTA